MSQLNLFDTAPETELPKAAPQTTVVKGKLYGLKPAQVHPDPAQPRKYFDPQALRELEASIITHGVLQPILVRPGSKEHFILVSGERRFQAAVNAGLTSIPALVTDGEPAEIAIVENLLRENLTAIEEAEAIEGLRSLHDYSLAELSAILGKADATISEILSLNKLPPEVKDDCRNDPKAARGILAVIARQKTREKMAALYKTYKKSGLTRGEIIRQSAPKSIKRALAPTDIAAFSEKLDRLVAADLTAEQKAALAAELEKLRSVAYQKLKLLKR